MLFMHRMHKYVYVSYVPHFSTLRKISIQNLSNLHKECDQLVAQYYFLVVVRSPTTHTNLKILITLIIVNTTTVVTT